MTMEPLMIQLLRFWQLSTKLLKSTQNFQGTVPNITNPLYITWKCYYQLCVASKIYFFHNYRSLLEAGGVDRLMTITRQRQRFTPRVVKFASQVLYSMWVHQDLRETYRKAGWKESDFVTKTVLFLVVVFKR